MWGSEDNEQNVYEYGQYSSGAGAYSRGTTSSNMQSTSYAPLQPLAHPPHFSNVQLSGSHHYEDNLSSGSTWTPPEGEGNYNDYYSHQRVTPNQSTYGIAHQSIGTPRPSIEAEQWPSNTVSRSRTESSSSFTQPGYSSQDRTFPYSPQAVSSSSQYGTQSGSSLPQVHNYAALPSMPQNAVESYLVHVKPFAGTSAGTSRNRAYQCTWPSCPKAARGEIFKSKDNARVHVQKHFGVDKSFQCVVEDCGQTFASEDAAKRHRDTKGKAFTCAYCNKGFARNDYRDMHQKRCTGS
ncbi:hypothetical protein K439DRAFT_1045255 [Ramaria rubella]|nr:hypothetical protein K439DRAFT_1045255 [Ramaria rubella]